MIFTKENIIKGALIYGVGDSIAALILNDFTFMRLLGIILIGGTVYAFEIPNYFYWIEFKTKHLYKYKKWIKMSLALLYFNPLWIVRHLCFVYFFSNHIDKINGTIFRIAFISFLINIPISMLANFIIQNKISLKWRFTSSAIFSGLMAIYYAMSIQWFG